MKKINKNILKNEILLAQTELVNLLFDDAVFDYDLVVNFDYEDSEVVCWFAVTDWFADWLEETGFIVLRTDLGNWWGREIYGQPIEVDFERFLED